MKDIKTIKEMITKAGGKFLDWNELGIWYNDLVSKSTLLENFETIELKDISVEYFRRRLKEKRDNFIRTKNKEEINEL